MTLVQQLRMLGGKCDGPNAYDDAADRINELEATLRNVQSALKSDSIECDDMRVIDNMINDALAGFTPETKGMTNE